jgi:protein N-terminal amidase
VICGYPEAANPEPSDLEGEDVKAAQSSDVAGEGEGVGYNSAVVVGPQGDIVGNYRKTFRFETDLNWAREGKPS